MRLVTHPPVVEAGEVKGLSVAVDFKSDDMSGIAADRRYHGKYLSTS